MNTQLDSPLPAETRPEPQDSDALMDYGEWEAFLKKLLGPNGPARATLQDWVATGRVKIPFIKVPGSGFVRFRPSSLVKWLAAQERNV